jgi:lysophospholipase L1-like esterase
MLKWLLAVVCVMSASLFAADGPVIDSMDDIGTFNAPKEKGKIEAVEGKAGKAIKFSFDKDCNGVFSMGKVRATPEWDNAAGISFWVKGDGSDHLGGLQFIYNEDYGVRYSCAFPIDSTEWKKVVIPWRDLISVLPKGTVTVDPKGETKPSKLGPVWVGKWWFWKDYEACSYTIDDIRLEPTIELDTKDYKPAGDPLARVLAKLKAGKPVTIVTMGDSLTDYGHWANKDTNWPTLLKNGLKEKYKSEVTIVNPAIGGTQLRSNLILIPRWLKQAPEPDLVTVLFGYNDFDGGMKGDMFYDTEKDTVDRVRRVTKGKADVLLLTTCPAVDKWDTFKELVDAEKKAAAEKNAGIGDTDAAFHEAGKANKEALYASDKTHMGAPGHQLIAKTIMDAIEKAGKP